MVICKQFFSQQSWPDRPKHVISEQKRSSNEAGMKSHIFPNATPSWCSNVAVLSWKLLRALQLRDGAELSARVLERLMWRQALMPTMHCFSPVTGDMRQLQHQWGQGVMLSSDEFTSQVKNLRETVVWRNLKNRQRALNWSIAAMYAVVGKVFETEALVLFR